ncbi:MAG: HAD-IA family hydrolase [Vicinamibacterales bacterium]
MIRFAVFDLDGTLVDSHQDLANSANALVAELGGPPLVDADVVAMVGEGAAVLVRRVLTAARLNPEAPGALARFLELYDERLVENTRAYPGIADALKQLRQQMPLAVLTNKPQRVTERLLGALDLSRHFVHVIGGDTALGRKPDPAGLLRLCAAAGVPAVEAVLVGDSPIDLETARRAGTQIVLARYGFGYRFDQRPDCLTAATAAEILRLLAT